MKKEKRYDFKTLGAVCLYAVILILSGYFLQHESNGIGIFIGISIVGLIVLVLMHSKRAIYKCIHCEEKFKISPITDLVSPHNMDTKYLKCPSCGKRGWHKELR